MATRLLTAAPISSCEPNTSSPCSPRDSTVISFAAASIALVSTAVATAASRSTITGFSSGSWAWSRDSSMICWTSLDRRSLSVRIRPAKRWTASGSSEASLTASASSRMAPTGVFSSWLTLATKSRRTSSTRFSRVRSSTSASTSRAPSGATRAVRVRAVPPAGAGRTSSLSRICPSRRTCATSSSSSGTTRVLPRTSPKAYAGAEALRTWSDSSTTTALDRRMLSTAATPAWTTGCSTSGRVWRWRSLMCHASTAPPAIDGPDDRGQTSLHRRIHAHIVRIGGTAARPDGRPAPSVHAPFIAHRRLFASAAYCLVHA